ncbi:MAG: lmo0937 family membrane protein [Gammaproteobacteria bacterium]|nr:lmo0937 family membrane protein [Gammaproteobacteria bacterium]
MWWTVFVILLVLWLAGLVTAHTVAGVIHILLVLALTLLVVNLMRGHA